MVYAVDRDGACRLTLVQAILNGYNQSFIDGNGVAGFAAYMGHLQLEATH